MNAAEERARFAEVARRVIPGGRLLRTWRLSGGISAGMTALEVVEAGGYRRLVVRQPGAQTLRRNPGAARDEFNLLRALHMLGQPTPAPFLLDESGEIFPLAYLVIEYVAGQPEFAPADRDDFARHSATQLARIHRLDVRRLDGVALTRRAGAFAEGIGEPPGALNQALAEGRIRAVLERVWPLPARNPLRLLHGDYWPGNLLWRAGQIAAVIGWEDARLGDPLCDLAISRLDWMCIFGRAAMEAFSAHYRAQIALDDALLPYWDLWAALRFIRLAGSDLAGWAAFYPPVGRADITAQTLRVDYQAFVEQAFERLAQRSG